MDKPTPFKLHVPDERLVRLRRKLEDSELPQEDLFAHEGGAGWEYGVTLSWAKEMKQYWAEEFDWRAVEAKINSFDNYKVTIEGISVHFVHQRSEEPNAIPIIMLHGWPGSFFEFTDIIGPLTSPKNGEQAFHVVVPSLPGFGFSGPPVKKGWTVRDTARVFDTLMSDVLGYKSYLAQGGDWGARVSSLLSDHPSCKAIHLNMCQVPPPTPYLFGAIYMLLPKSVSQRFFRWYFLPEEYKQVVRSFELIKHGLGYFAVQATQPMTIGYALNDNPLGLLIWIGEKYKLLDSPISRADLIATVSIYFHSQSFHTSCLPYYENFTQMSERPVKINKTIVGVSAFPMDIFVMPKRWIVRRHGDKLVFHRWHEEGGHFPALECPDLLSKDIRDFVGPHRTLLLEHTAQ